jgi:hypothetical protein
MSLGDSGFLPAVKNVDWTATEKHFPFLFKLRSLQPGIKTGSMQLGHRRYDAIAPGDIHTQFH